MFVLCKCFGAEPVYKGSFPIDRFKAVPLLQCFFVCKSVVSYADITKTCLFKYIENFTTKKGKKNQIKNSYIFHISAQNIICGYSLEPPRRGGTNEYHNLCF